MTCPPEHSGDVLDSSDPGRCLLQDHLRDRSPVPVSGLGVFASRFSMMPTPFLKEPAQTLVDFSKEIEGVTRPGSVARRRRLVILRCHVRRCYQRRLAQTGSPRYFREEREHWPVTQPIGWGGRSRGSASQRVRSRAGTRRRQRLASPRRRSKSQSSTKPVSPTPVTPTIPVRGSSSVVRAGDS